jgi:hypothetical protein
VNLDRKTKVEIASGELANRALNLTGLRPAG